jgi:hypothetical protein
VTRAIAAYRTSARIRSGHSVAALMNNGPDDVYAISAACSLPTASSTAMRSPTSSSMLTSPVPTSDSPVPRRSMMISRVNSPMRSSMRATPGTWEMIPVLKTRSTGPSLRTR